jgi:outer membrane lipoprotein-sorting protein
MQQTKTYLLSAILLLACLFPFHLYAWNPSDAQFLLKRMEGAYAEVNDYQANMEVRTFGKDGSFETRIFLYTFKKPKKIRLDFESPYAGMIIVYPDQNGKVALRRYLTFHLAPDNFLLQASAGQRIDQTDMGLLITNIFHSLTDHQQGPLTVTEDEKDIRIRVMADDHFREGVVTQYQFFIDKGLWLPVKVEESSPDGLLERTIVFRNLRTNIDVPDNFFQLNGR